ncbi:hypothetical protein G6F70_009016 [Rhizopus microsporus]|uniref:Uncharacterized protein n=1 Tax=Rhizopus microsporus TaxID=58291 RepID=A0A1X0RQN0_RHIZD|nr:hypothetical protein G6F71_004698 [Rhizopus microsporus]KAG1193761.1 hypothetical protein G6F70_009016 [Rhizopus microsporus]KAG1206221.1 hypothetical protein G6F69_008991 [Rhizopus microsporus]KAG1258015.1 hypothetical protein G6F68_009005 [Rhizopus microsporus]ORE14382.1 hypothetical protein BCV71DRAFT_229323 [Rhizopus microsporus]
MSYIQLQRTRLRMMNKTSSVSSSSDLIVPSIEESLQDWLSRDNSCTYLLDICRCCNKSNCDNLQTLILGIQKLEEDARLAAEIGQSLLNKHEQYVIESNEAISGLESQVQESQEKIHELEQLLIQSDTVKYDLEQEKNKLNWEWQKTQKMLDDTLLDVESYHQRINQLTSELDSKTREIDKLKKLMAHQADAREDHLRFALEDMKQELANSKKAELCLESKYKKLKEKYDQLCEEKKQLTNDQEPSERLHKDPNKITASSLLLNNTSSYIHSPTESIPSDCNNNNNHYVELIKELVLVNNKLRTDLLTCKDLLSESRTEAVGLIAKIERDYIDDDDTTMTDQQEIWPQNNITCDTVSSSAVVHHHYHYHMRNNKGKPSSLSSNQTPCQPTENSTETMSPYRHLHRQLCVLLERLQQTDTRALNRKLRRAFDIFDLSSMSNSIIENILTAEINELAHVFPCHSKEQDFSLLVKVTQDMLKEIGQLRTNINDLQVEYVKKVEEIDNRLEQELIKRKYQKEQAKKKNTALTWLSSVFQKSTASSNNIIQQHEIIIHSPAIIIPSPSPNKMEEYRNGPPSSYPIRSSLPSAKRRNNYALHASQSAILPVQKSVYVKKRRSSVVISSGDATTWLGNKINQ